MSRFEFHKREKSAGMCKENLNEDKRRIECVNKQHPICRTLLANEACYYNRRHVIRVENRCKWILNLHAH